MSVDSLRREQMGWRSRSLFSAFAVIAFGFCELIATLIANGTITAAEHGGVWMPLGFVFLAIAMLI